MSLPNLIFEFFMVLSLNKILQGLMNKLWDLKACKQIRKLGQTFAAAGQNMEKSLSKLIL